MNHGLGQYVSVRWCAVCGARVRTSASWLSDAHASLRLHGMMREGIRHIVLNPLSTSQKSVKNLVGFLGDLKTPKFHSEIY